MKILRNGLFVFILTFLFTLNVNASVKGETLKEACEAEGLTCNFTEKDTSKLPSVYVFRGTGCGYCKRLITHLASIYDKYSDKVNIVLYEVTSNQDNYALYEKVAAKFSDTVQGYPYLVIGKTKFDGYASSFDSDIKAALDSMNSESYDVVAEVNAGNTDIVEAESVNSEEKNNTGAVLAFIFGVVVVLGVIMGYSVKKK